MEDDSFENVLDAFQKTNEITKLLKISTSIRRNVNWPKDRENINKLREKECLKQIVCNLLSSKKSIVDVSLSILGNCCMDKICARELVGQYQVFSPLNQVLKKHGKEDSVNGRVFRIIGNLCSHKDLWANVVVDRKPELVSYMVSFITNVAEDKIPDDVSDATVVMALRCLRLLLNCKTLITLVKTLGVLRAVGLLLIKYSSKWCETKEHESILQNIIKLLQDYSRYKYYPSIIETRNTLKGDSLVHLGKILLLSPKRIVKIVMNFIRMSQLKSDLPIPAIFEGFTSVLRQNTSLIKDLNEDCLGYIRCICYLLDHPANRHPSHCSETIPLLVQVLDTLDEPSNKIIECCILVFLTLNKFRYGSRFDEQIKCNIIEILIKKLEWISGSSRTLNLEHRWRKRLLVDYSFDSKRMKKDNDFFFNKRGCTGIGKAIQYPKPSVYEDEELDFTWYHKFENIIPSPPSPVSESEMALTWSSPGSSPSSSCINANESDSDDYSPVCSEADNLEFPLTFPDGNDSDIQKEMDLGDYLVDDASSLPSVKENPLESNSALKLRLLNEITMLLRSYLWITPPPSQMCSENLILALLQCCVEKYSKIPDIVDIICRIVSIQDYLIPFLQTDVIPMIHTMTELRHDMSCKKCKKFRDIGMKILYSFSNLAESEMGYSSILSKFIKGSDHIKTRMVLTLTYIIKKTETLSLFMVKHKGLETLLDLLGDEDEMQMKGVKVLCFMAVKHLLMRSPREQQEMCRSKISAGEYRLTEDCQNIVTIKLDDGSCLKTDREFLSKQSDFFTSLLDGSFKESFEDLICLHEAELKSLSCVLHLLHSNIHKTNSPYEIDLDCGTLLEMIVLSDRYLLGDLCVFLVDCVQKYHLTPESVCQIYKWSIDSKTNFLRVECIAYALVGVMTDSERSHVFRRLLQLGFRDEIPGDLRKLFLRHLERCASPPNVFGPRFAFKTETKI